MVTFVMRSSMQSVSDVLSTTTGLPPRSSKSSLPSSYIYSTYQSHEYVASTIEAYVHDHAEYLGLHQTTFRPSGCYLWGYDKETLRNNGAPQISAEEQQQMHVVPSDVKEQYFQYTKEMNRFQDYISNDFSLHLPPVVDRDVHSSDSTTDTQQPYSDVRQALRHYNHSVVCDALDVSWNGAKLASTSVDKTSLQLLSHIQYTGQDGRSVSEKQFLEPLLPQLRHTDICENKGKYLMDMKYMVHDFRYMCRRMTPHSRTIFIDMGGSLLFHSGTANPAIYVATLYQQFGIVFDHVYAFEMTPFSPEQTKTLFASNIPEMWRTSYHWINVGVDSTVNSRLNPFTMIKEQFLPEDLVVVKLDIDTPSVELPLAMELLNDPQLHALVDQFYFEYHVHLKELKEWGDNVEGSIYDALHLMRQLRERGVATHFWV